MLHSFLSENRDQLIGRCREKAAARPRPDSDAREITHGIPLFFDQLIETLTLEQTADSGRSVSLSGNPGGGSSSEIGDAAIRHGRELLKIGFSMEEVVRDYGDVCQAVTDLAVETKASIAVDEFRTLNRCLDNAIAGAVSEFARQQVAFAAEEGMSALDSRLGPLAHELRNYLHVAMHALKALKGGNVGISGATGAVLERSLLGMQHLIDGSLVAVRVTAGLPPRAEAIRLAEFLADVESAALLDPRARSIKLTVTPVGDDIAVFADREMLASAVGNLLQNGFKFTKRNTEVRLHTFSERGRVLIEVQDHCGGLPPGPAENLLKPFAQRSNDRSGLGLGLDICRRSIESNHGSLRVRDVPGVGCIFTIDLPRHAEIPLHA